MINTRLIVAKDGTDILEISKDNKSYRMNSLYSPIREAEKFAEQFKELSENSVLVIFGYGNGVFPEAIMKACSDQVKVVFYEPNQAIIKNNIIQYKEVRELLGIRGWLVIPESMENDKHVVAIAEFPKLLSELVHYSNQNQVEYVSLPKYRDIFVEQYENFVEQIQYRIRRVSANTATAKLMGEAAVINNIKNLRYVPYCYAADSFLGIFPSDMRAIIVSAGPSLEKNVKFLENAKGNSLIMCVDSAVKYLLKENIVPDLLVSVDPQKPLSLFDDERMNGIPIIGSTDMNYRILEMLPDSKIIFSTTENTYINMLFDIVGHEIEHLESGGSVANLAFSLCLYWGIRNIVLVGQDLTLTDGQMYVGGNKLPEGSVKSPMRVEDIYGNNIYTTKEYYAYLRWFEQIIALHPETKVIDATEGGARIAGTEIKELKDVISEVVGTKFVFEKSLNEIAPAFSEEKRIIILKKIQDSKNNLSELQDRLSKGIGLSNKAINMAGQLAPKSKEFQELDSEIQKICDFYDSFDEDFVIQRQIDAVYLEEFMGLFDGMEYLSPIEKYKRLKRYFEILAAATDKVSIVWNEINFDNV